MRRSASSSYRSELLDHHVEQGLFDKRRQTREKALFEIIKAFKHDTTHEVAQTKFATIMFQCLKLVKKGSVNEICLATKAIGLLALILGPGDNAHELYNESLSTYSQALKVESQSVKVLECLAIVTLVGATDFYDTERSMKTIWEFVHSNLGSNMISNKVSEHVLAAAISAWSFLLATIDPSRLDHKYWQGAISYLLNLLEEWESARATCVQALAIIFEKGYMEKFSSEAYKVLFHSLDHKEDTTLCLREWKQEIIEKIKKACGPNWEDLRIFEDEYRLENSISIYGNSLTISTMSQLKKVKLLERFLGNGFEMHMLENELLHRVFDFEPKVDQPKDDPIGPEMHISETEEVNVRYFSPNIRNDKCFLRRERSPNSLLSKARTQLMKKKRMLAQAQEMKIGELIG